MTTFLDGIFDDSDMLGNDDDAGEDLDLGIDYQVADANIVNNFQQPRKFVFENPSDGYRAKILKGTIERFAQTDDGLVIYFTDKRKLIITRG